MNNKKLLTRLICLALSAIMLFSLAACKKTENDSANMKMEATNDTKDKTEETANSSENNTSINNINSNNNINSINNNTSNVENAYATYINANPAKNTEYIDNKERSLYQINCNLDNDKKMLNCNETISFVNTTGVDLNNISLHLYPDFYAEDGVYSIETKQYVVNAEYADITINKVAINGNEIKFTQDIELLKFDLPEKLSNNETVDIYIEFDVKMPYTVMRLTCTDDDYTVTYWYPIVCMYNTETNSWDERAYYPNGESNFGYYNDYDVNITVPKDYVVVGTGIETEVSSDNTIKVYNLKEENVKDFVFFASQDYKAVTAKVDDIEINSYYKENKAFAQRMLDDIIAAMEYMNKAIGKYPFKEFDIVESNIVGFAMEYPTIIQMGEYNEKISDTITRNNLSWNDSAVVHEMIHQWFFNIVGNDCYSEPILDETLTEFMTGTYFTYKYGAGNPISVENSVNTSNFSSELLPLNQAVDEFRNANWYFSTIYSLGWYIFEDIKTQIGYEKVIEVFRSYFSKYQFTNATVENLLDEFENVCGKDVRDNVDKLINTKEYNVDKLKQQYY